MTVDRSGNVLKVPGHYVGPSYLETEILGSYARFTQKGLTLKAGSGVLEAGTLLKVSSTAKKYTGSTVVGDAHLGILRKGVDATATDVLANYVKSGIVKLDKLKYADGTAVPSGDYATIATALGGKIDPIMNWLIL